MKVYEYIVRIKDQATDKLGRLAANTRNTASRLDDVTKGFGRAQSASASFANSGSQSLNQFNQRLNQSRTGLFRFRQDMNDSSNSTNMFGNALGLVTRWLGPVALASALATGTLNASKLARQFEQTRISFEVMIGSAKQGRSLLGGIEDMAIKTPFKSSDLQSSGKLLLGYGVSAQKILPTLRMLGDIAGGNAEKLHFLSLAYAQTQAAGRLMGQDLLQMVNAGFNPLQTISEKTGISIGKLKKQMEEGAISAKMVEAAFRAATQEGGRFFNMSEKQSTTFEGRLNALSEKFDIWLRGIGTNLNERLAPYLDKAIEIIDRWIDPQGALGKAADKQRDSFHQLYLNTTPLIQRYEKLLALRTRTKDQEAEMLKITDKLGKAIPLSVTSKLGASNTTIDLGVAKKFVEEQQSLFTESNKLAIDDTLGKQNALRDQMEELRSVNKLLQDDKGVGTKGMRDVQDKYLRDDRSLFDKYVLGTQHDADKVSTTFKNALSQGDHNTVLTLLNVEMNKLNEEALKLDQRLSKLRTDQVTTFLPDEKGTTDDWATMGKDIMGKKGGKEKDGIDRITGGGKQAVNVTINVNTLNGIANVEEVNGQMEIQDLLRMMEKAATEAVIRVINSGNYAAAQ